MVLDEEEFKKLEKPSYDLEEEKEESKKMLYDAYMNIIDLLKEYLDIKEEYYNIIALWIIGTYFHEEFPSYPFLFFNAMKGSGKTRAMNLITFLSKDGEMLNNMTEAVLFRTQGTLAIDEFEGVTRKGKESLRELLNSCYKRGTKVKRMAQKKTMEGTKQVVEEFSIYRPIILANIWGMEEVLGDRCITLILDKSNRIEVTNLIEIFQEDEKAKKTKELLKGCSLCRCSFCAELYLKWNNFIKNYNNNYTNYTNYTNHTNCINYTKLFESIKFMGLNGRELELSFPLTLIAYEISDEILKKTTPTLRNLFYERRIEEKVESKDLNLIEFTASRLQKDYFESINNLVQEFKESFGLTEEWINAKWFGRALKRLNLIVDRRRTKRGVEVILNIVKAQEQLKKEK